MRRSLSGWTHDLEEEVRGVLLEGWVADLIDDDQPVAPCQFLGQFAGLAAGSRRLRRSAICIERGRTLCPQTTP